MSSLLNALRLDLDSAEYTFALAHDLLEKPLREIRALMLATYYTSLMEGSSCGPGQSIGTCLGTYLENDDRGDVDPSSPPNRIAVVEVDFTLRGNIRNVTIEKSVVG